MTLGRVASTKSTHKPARRAGSRRRLLAWTLFAAAVSVVGLWVVSVWWRIGVSVGSCDVVADSGAFSVLCYSRERPQPDLLWAHGTLRTSVEWWINEPLVDPLFEGGVVQVEQFTMVGASRDVYVTVLLWPIALLATVGGAGLIVNARRAPRREIARKKCSACGYELIGLPLGAPCPECGPRT